jgi:transcriptional regulator with XRE-family HTH domain
MGRTAGGIRGLQAWEAGIAAKVRQTACKVGSRASAHHHFIPGTLKGGVQLFEHRELAQLVRTGLEERGISQRQLAHRSGVHHSTICRLLKGDRRPTHQTAVRLTRVLSGSPAGPVALREFLRRDPYLEEHDISRIVDLYDTIRRLH